MRRLSLRRTILFLCLCCAVAPIGSPAQTLETLHSFDGTDGEYPMAALVQAADGNFYGTTLLGGNSSACGVDGCGTVLKITKGGTLTTLHSFDGADGYYVEAGLATDGNFYGTTASGETNSACGIDIGCGEVFRINPAGKLKVLNRFDGPDGFMPIAGLVRGPDGNFYGTTAGGGAFSTNCGEVFRINPAGKLKVLHSFDGPDGCFPVAGLIQATDGNFYGTTLVGGSYSDPYIPAGTVFKMTPSGTLTTLYSFCDFCPDGAYPMAGLLQGTDGNFYGTTYEGGANSVGTVFEMTPDGTLAPLYSFCSQPNCTDGDTPSSNLVQGTDGNFYGTTVYGGANSCILLGTDRGCGTVFKITADGTLTTLHSFDGTGGKYPEAALVQATDGNFYGTTFKGGIGSACGVDGCGTVFRMAVP